MLPLPVQSSMSSTPTPAWCPPRVLPRVHRSTSCLDHRRGTPGPHRACVRIHPQWREGAMTALSRPWRQVRAPPDVAPIPRPGLRRQESWGRRQWSAGGGGGNIMWRADSRGTGDGLTQFCGQVRAWGGVMGGWRGWGTGEPQLFELVTFWFLLNSPIFPWSTHSDL